MANNYEEHSLDENGWCIVCGKPVHPTDGVMYEESTDGSFVKVVGYEGSSTKVKIASVYNDLPVTTIDANAFAGNITITNIVIPDSITTIGNNAFANCPSLVSMIIPSSVVNMGDNVFANSNVLVTIYCEVQTQPSGWLEDWSSCKLPYWYSESEPTTSGNYWRYVNGEPTKW